RRLIQAPRQGRPSRRGVDRNLIGDAVLCIAGSRPSRRGVDRNRAARYPPAGTLSGSKGLQQERLQRMDMRREGPCMQKASLPTVLVTGRSGFVGRAIAQGRQRSYRVSGLDVAQRADPLAGMETIEIDLTWERSVGDALEQVRTRTGGRIA